MDLYVYLDRCLLSNQNNPPQIAFKSKKQKNANAFFDLKSMNKILNENLK